jgi:hypothetical protein
LRFVALPGAAIKYPRFSGLAGRREQKRASLWIERSHVQGTDQRIHHRAAVISLLQSGLGYPWQWPGNRRTHYRPGRPS